MTDLPRRADIHEEGPREGFHIEPDPISTSDKTRLIDAFAESGLHHIEAASSVSPKIGPGRADAEDDVTNLTPKHRRTRMIVRIYTGQDGQTHFEDLPLPAAEGRNVALQPGANLVFRSFPADYWSDWHTAPRRQYIFILAGQMEIGIGDGTTRRFGPGDVVLADDLTGQGHTTRSLGVARVSATVPVSA